ncbi:MAG: hypothetical protein QOI21_2146 [Actinomycetota bacterium]|jgi:hypothetical protein|nr:hypothetical protein [Actinomycetota bacterium]
MATAACSKALPHRHEKSKCVIKRRACLVAIAAALLAAGFLNATTATAATDDTTQIQSLLDHPVNGTVDLPRGVFTVAPTLRLHNSAAIVGHDTTLRVAAQAGNYYAMLTADTPGRDLSGLKITGVTFDQNAPNNPVEKSTLFNGYPRFAIFFYVGSGIEITGNSFVNSDNLNTVVTGARVTKSTISNNRFETIDIAKHDHSSVYLHSTEVIVSNNVFIGSSVYGAAVDTHGENIQILNNSVSGYYRGMNVVSPNTLVANNTVSMAVNVVDLWSVANEGPLHDVTIKDNTLYPAVDYWLAFLNLKVPALYTTPVIYDYTSTMPFIRITVTYTSPLDQRYYADPALRRLLGWSTGPEAHNSGIRYRTYQFGMLYWSAQTGVHEVHGAILTRYLRLGGHSRFGPPSTDETTTPDQVGRYNHFAGTPATGPASIYWSPRTGANAIWGAINARWSQLSREQGPMGYPVTDESVTPDQVGRYNHFDRAGSIYWTPATGAQEVYGAIRRQWAALGWERSYLGYPTSGEFSVYQGRRNNFRYGFINWNALTGATFHHRY